jgi:hypothetical protein
MKLAPLIVWVAVLAAAVGAQQAPTPPEAVVRTTLEELRKGELFLDAEALGPFMAASVTLLEADGRVSGSFALLEPVRRMRERGAVVKELAFDQVSIRVYGASAAVTYRYRKTIVDNGSRRTQQGWCSDVFELRDDGAWLLVLRHRGR